MDDDDDSDDGDDDDDDDHGSVPAGAADDDDDDEEVVAAVVVDDDDDDDGDDGDTVASVPVVEAVVAEPVVATKKAPAQPKPKRKKSPSKPKKKAAADKKSASSKKPAAGAEKKKRKRPAAGTADRLSAKELYKSLPPQRVEAARDARVMLQETVPNLPVPVAETTVRSFGRLCIQSSPVVSSGPAAAKKAKKDGSSEQGSSSSKFTTTSALYPVGFSCDRYEFSPVHGRILKLRCSILDGKTVKTKQKKAGFAVDANLPDGPVFRIMWGRGVDEDVSDDSIEYPFDPETTAPPLVATGSTKTDAALKEATKAKPARIIPEEGMRVRVRFDKGRYVCGTIDDVGEPKFVTSSTGKRKHKNVEISIKYDGGYTENLTYPDADVDLVAPCKYFC